MNKKYLLICIGMVLTWVISTFSIVMGQANHLQHGAHPAGTIEKSFQAKMTVPDEISQGRAFPIKILIRGDRGQNVSDFDMFQEKRMHLILVSDDLELFRHLHPEHKGNGYFLTETMLPEAGPYTLFCDYKPTGQKEQVSILKLSVKGTKQIPEPVNAKRTEKIVEDTEISLNFSPEKVKPNEEITLKFDLKQAADGLPAKGLQPYLGEKGHLVVIRKSTALTASNYIHAHAMKEGGASEIKFMTRFPDAGIYKLWCQFNREGKILIADFWINVER